MAGQDTGNISLDEILATIREDLETKHRAREAALATCREVIRQASLCIRAVHRHEFDRAAAMLEETHQRTRAAQELLVDHPEIYHAGFLHDAVKEYAEAALTLALVTGRPLPTPAELDVSSAAYLHGLAEAAGELRRYVLDSLRDADRSRPEELLVAMDEIYAALVTVDFPEAITHGLRRSTDMVRGVTERTRGDLTVAALQRQLHREIVELRARLEQHGSGT